MQRPHTLAQKLTAFLLCLASAAALAQTPAASDAETRGDATARIREEGLNRSQVMDLAAFICDDIGPRLTGSPALKRANEWTRDKMAQWGLTNAHLEAWGPFGQGWTLERFSAQVIEPYAFPLIATPKAWSPGLARPLAAEAIYLNAANEKELDTFKGKLRGAAVLLSPAREVKPLFEPPALRLTDAELLALANAAEGAPRRPRRPASPAATNAPAARRAAARPPAAEPSAAPRPAAAADAPTNAAPPRRITSVDRFQFAVREGAALFVTSSSQGDGGTLFVGSASVPAPDPKDTNALARARGYVPPWSTNAAGVPPQVTVGVEDYHRLLRLAQHGAKPKIAVELQARFQTNDLQAYNTIAEWPGTDLKDQVVMLGAHLDSCHPGTGATDDACGVAVVMEAVRLLKTLQLQPRRTIRVGLWSGEEQGLLGSKAYVTEHFGYYTNLTNNQVAQSPKDQAAAPKTKPPATTRKLVRGPEYDRLSAYFNFDNGTGKIRGVYLQGNEAVRPFFRRWLEPLRDLGAATLTSVNTGGTDHLPFDAIGLPAFQFIQDPVEYNSRTHHSNADVLDRLQPDDLKQAAVVMATFAYQAAMLDDNLPRKPKQPTD